jgi:hypothetical protein
MGYRNHGRCPIETLKLFTGSGTSRDSDIAGESNWEESRISIATQEG